MENMRIFNRNGVQIMTKRSLKPNTFFYEDDYGNSYHLTFYRMRYIDGNLCICCNCSEDGIVYEPYATITKNFPNYSTKSDYWAVFDWNNCSKLIQELVDRNILFDYGHRLRSGFCDYPILEIDKTWLDSLPTKGE